MSVRSLFLCMYDCYCSEDAILRCYDASARPSPRAIQNGDTGRRCDADIDNPSPERQLSDRWGNNWFE